MTDEALLYKKILARATSRAGVGSARLSFFFFIFFLTCLTLDFCAASTLDQRSAKRLICGRMVFASCPGVAEASWSATPPLPDGTVIGSGTRGLCRRGVNCYTLDWPRWPGAVFRTTIPLPDGCNNFSLIGEPQLRQVTVSRVYCVENGGL